MFGIVFMSCSRDNHGHKFWDILIFYVIFFSAQMKQGIIVSNEKSIDELPHVSPNNLTLRIFGN